MIPLTALILAHNEKENIAQSLGALPLVDVLLIDSFSSDGSPEIAKSANRKVRVVQRKFDSFAGQCNFGLDQISTEWVLSLDADYLLTPGLASEVSALDPSSDVAGYSAEFVYAIFGHPLRASIYPARTVLYRRDKARYVDEGHGHRVVIQGRVEKLVGKIFHDDRKPFSHWIQSQDRYAKLEARHLLKSGQRKSDGRHAAPLSVQDRLRLKIFFAAPAIFLYLFFWRGLILDGWPGWFYVAQRTIAELLLSVRLLIERHRLEEPMSQKSEVTDQRSERRDAAR